MTAIVGTRRTEPWLQLTEDGMELRFRLLDGLNDRRNVLIGSAFTRDPKPGDVVVEVTRAVWSPNQDIRKIGIGVLLARDGGTYYVQYGPGPEDVADWGNCAFAVVPPVLIDRLVAS